MIKFYCDAGALTEAAFDLNPAAAVMPAGYAGIHIADAEMFLVIYSLVLEALPQFLQLFRRDAGAVVFDFQKNRIISVGRGNPDEDIGRAGGNTVKDTVFQKRLQCKTADQEILDAVFESD